MTSTQIANYIVSSDQEPDAISSNREADNNNVDAKKQAVLNSALLQKSYKGGQL